MYQQKKSVLQMCAPCKSRAGVFVRRAVCEAMQMYLLSGRFRAVDILREDLWPRIVEEN